MTARPRRLRRPRLPRLPRLPRGALRRAYGAGPAHLLGISAGFAIAAAAVAGWFQRPRDGPSIVVWFAIAIIAHDLVLVPLYSLLDRIAFGRRRAAPTPATTHAPTSATTRAPALGRVSVVPYVRIPAILSFLLLLVFFPVILGLGARAELTATGIAEHGYLARWLLATSAMFGASALAYAIARQRAAGRARTRPSRRRSPPLR